MLEKERERKKSRSVINLKLKYFKQSTALKRFFVARSALFYLTRRGYITFGDNFFLFLSLLVISNNGSISEKRFLPEKIIGFSLVAHQP